MVDRRLTPFGFGDVAGLLAAGWITVVCGILLVTTGPLAPTPFAQSRTYAAPPPPRAAADYAWAQSDWSYVVWAQAADGSISISRWEAASPEFAPLDPQIVEAARRDGALVVQQAQAARPS